MPTAARLMAAFCLAVLALVLSQMIIPLLPDGTDYSYFIPTNMALGVLAGWVVMGPRAATTVGAGISNGLTGTFVLILWGLATQGVIEMLNRSMQRRYDGLGEATLAVISLGAEYFLIMATVPVAIAAVVGGSISGLLTFYAVRKWR